MFGIYFKLGVQHIADILAYDHIVFLLVLCGVYVLKQWKELLVLITAFTIGHSASLAAAVFDLVHFDSGLIEFLIGLTIFMTAVGNFVMPAGVNRKSRKVKYFLALFFGLIHGLGFSNYLQSLLDEGSKLVPLFSFNLGVEVGQLLIVSIILIIGAAFTTLVKVSQRDWTLVVSGMGLGIAGSMMIDRWPF